jgi:hypothetical protein
MLAAQENENTITLPSNVVWPDMLSTVLYVRYFYKDLWEHVLQHGVPLPENRGAVIMGTPGSAYGLLAQYVVHAALFCESCMVLLSVPCS